MAKVTAGEYVSEQLTDHEMKQMTIGPAITTVTFCRGDINAVTVVLKERLLSIVQANPWLAGRLVKEGGKLFNRFPKAVSSVEECLNPSTRGGKTLPIPVVDSTMDYFTVCQVLGGSAAEIMKGSSCIGKDCLLFALSIIPDAKRPADTFALVISGSHVIIDGFTYYKLLSMLCDGAEIKAMNPVRKHEIMEQSKQAMGEKESLFANGGGVLCNVLGGLMCGSKPLIESFYVDKEKVNALKAQKGNDVDFVSTNDVLTSQFGNATNADFLLMPLNFREKLPLFTTDDAGNYEGALVFLKEDYADASLIRKSLQSGPPRYLRGGSATPGALPGCCKACKGRMAMVTNWTFPFFSELKIEGCQQMLHLPLCDVKMVPFEVGVVYRPRAGEIAVTFFVRSLDRDTILKTMPMEKLVPSAEECLANAQAVTGANGNDK